MNKKFTLLTLMVLSIFGLSLNSQAQTTDLIISEYAEGSSNNKYIELYNGTGATIDLSNYEMWRISNGGAWPESTVALSGMLLDGEVIVLANSSADTAITNLSNATTLFSSATFFNGNDAVGLAKDDGTGTFFLIDAVGTHGPDPGSGWNVGDTINGTAEHTLVRKDTVCSPDTTWTVTAGTNNANSQWIVYPQNTWTYAGSHTASCSSGPTSSDTTKPEIITGQFNSTTSVTLVFSEPVTSATAQNTANYIFAPGITVTNAVLSSSEDTVNLTVSPSFVNGTQYGVSITSIVDTSANANMMDPFTGAFYFNSYTGTDLMITEIYYGQNSSGIQDLDYFEVYNAGSSSISLAGMEISSGMPFEIQTNVVLAAGSYMIFAENLDSFNLAFPTVTNVVGINNGGSLSGGGETIELSNTLGDVVASVSYMSSAPWPGYTAIESIELCDLTTDYTDAANWYVAGTVSSTVGDMLYGTPGSANSCAAPPVIPTYDIATVRTVDANGEPDSLGVYCAVEGIVYGVDLDGNNGISFTVIDETRGINIFNFNDVDAYVVTEGDEIRVVGEIDFYNGLIELFADSITVLSTGNCIPFPTIVDALGEETESEYIEMKNVTLADPSQWPTPGNNANIDVVTSNGDTVTMRLDRDTHIQDSILSAPSGTFNLIGIGGQFDNSSPYLDGYQIFPMFVTDVDSNAYLAPANVQINELAVTNVSTFDAGLGNYYQWAEFFNNSGADLDVSGYFLSNDSTNVFMERVRRCFDNNPASAVISDGDYAIGFLGTDGTEGFQYFETELDVNMPFIGLYTPNGTLVSGVVFTADAAVEGYTFGAKNDDYAQGAVTFEAGTPEATNATGTILSVLSILPENGLSIYPNPVVSDNVTFNKTVSVTVYSITGQVILVQQNINTLNVSSFESGMYLIETTEGEIVKMIVK